MSMKLHRDDVRLMAILMAALLPVTASAAGRIYKCRSATGDVYYSQSFDKKNCAGGGAQLNPEGVPIRRIERQKSAAELAADKIEAAKAAERQAKIDDAATADRSLMATFGNESELNAYYKEQLSVADSEIDAAQAALQHMNGSLGGLLSAAADAERAGKPVPKRVADNITTLRKNMDQQRGHIATRRARKSELVLEREFKIKRFRELTDAANAPRTAEVP